MKNTIKVVGITLPRLMTIGSLDGSGIGNFLNQKWCENVVDDSELYMKKLGMLLGVIALRDRNFRDKDVDLVARDYVTKRILESPVGINFLGLEMDNVATVNDNTIRLTIEVPDPEGYYYTKFNRSELEGLWYDEKRVYLDVRYDEFVILEKLGVLQVIEIDNPLETEDKESESTISSSLPQLHEIWEHNETKKRYLVKDNKMIDASLGEHRMMIRYSLVGNNQDYVREITDFTENFTLIA